MKITSGLLVKNSFFNFIGMVLPLFVMVFTIPYVVRGLGAERFGVLALLLVFIDYFSICDLGLGRATTKFIAEALGKGESERGANIYWTSLVFVFSCSVIGALVFLLFAPALAERLFSVSSNLAIEMKKVFSISSPLIPFILIRLVSNGVLEAYQRFDLINLIRIPFSIVSGIIPVVVIYFGYGLTTIIFCIVINEFIKLLGYYLVSLKVIPRIKLRLLDFKSFKPILAFGGWLSITRIITWIMLNVQNLLIGSLITVAAVTYYNIPYSLTAKMTIIGASIAPVIFPAISLFHATNKEKSTKLLIHSLKYTIALYGLPTLILTVFSKELLILWLGSDFQQSIIVLQILAIGMLFSGIGWIFGTFIDGTGHPKYVTIIGLFQAPIDILVTWLLIKTLGIAGAALGWTCMRGLTVFIFYITCWKLNLCRLSLENNSRLAKVIAPIALILGVNFTLKSFLTLSITTAVANVLILIIGYIVVIWYNLVTAEQKEVIFRKMKDMLALTSLSKENFYSHEKRFKDPF